MAHRLPPVGGTGIQCLKLYGTGSATANAVAQITIPKAGHLIGVQISLHGTSITATSNVKCEVSRASAREIAVNGAQQCIAEVGLWNNFVTSGMDMLSSNLFVPVQVPIVQGQIIYLHAVVNGTFTYDFTGVIWYH